MQPDNKTSEQRHFIRHPISFPLSYTVISKKKEEEISSVTENISREGLLFTSRQAVEKNSLITIKMPFRERMFSTQAKVVYCNKDPQMELYNIGVCFQNPDEAFRIRLIEQMYLISEYRNLRSVQLGKDISLSDASKEWIKKYSKKFQKRYW